MQSTFACDMTAIPLAERETHHELIRRLMSEVVHEIRELPDGLAFRFPAEEYESVAQFVGRERLCCPFLNITLELPAEGGSLWLRLTGAGGVTDFIRAELRLSDSGSAPLAT